MPIREDLLEDWLFISLSIYRVDPVSLYRLCSRCSMFLLGHRVNPLRFAYETVCSALFGAFPSPKGRPVAR